MWNPNGEREVENRGRTPDIEIEHDPELVRPGYDPQLEKAGQAVLAELEKHPVPKPKRPTYSSYPAKERSSKGAPIPSGALDEGRGA